MHMQARRKVCVHVLILTNVHDVINTGNRHKHECTLYLGLGISTSMHTYTLACTLTALVLGHSYGGG